MALYVNGKKVAGIGLPGKSAYQYAVDGGYAGTEEEFEEMLANAGNKPLAHGVTLSASAWSSNTQTVTISPFWSISCFPRAISAAVPGFVNVGSCVPVSIAAILAGKSLAAIGAELPSFALIASATAFSLSP